MTIVLLCSKTWYTVQLPMWIEKRYKQFWIYQCGTSKNRQYNGQYKWQEDKQLSTNYYTYNQKKMNKTNQTIKNRGEFYWSGRVSSSSSTSDTRLVAIFNNPMISHKERTWYCDYVTRERGQVIIFNSSFINISAISWRTVLLVEEREHLEKTTDLQQVTDKLYHIM